MKSTLSIGLIFLTSILSAANGNAQTEPQSQPSLQPTCVAIKPSERSTPTTEQPTSQDSTQVQQSSECALNVQSRLERREPLLLERDRLIKERFEQRIIPPQD